VTKATNERGCCGNPDLAVGILSPDNAKKKARLKNELYEASDVREYWIVNPTEANIVVHILNKSGRFDAGCETIPSVGVTGSE
jgi:Uma2 family endonuclease